MLEIVILFVLSRRIAAIARSKGRSAAGWTVLLIGLWILGEVTGAVAVAVAVLLTSADEDPNLSLALLGAIAGAAAGAFTTFAIVKRLPAVGVEDKYWRPPADEAYR